MSSDRVSGDSDVAETEGAAAEARPKPSEAEIKAQLGAWLQTANLEPSAFHPRPSRLEALGADLGRVVVLGALLDDANPQHAHCAAQLQINSAPSNSFGRWARTSLAHSFGVIALGGGVGREAERSLAALGSGVVWVLCQQRGETTHEQLTSAEGGGWDPSGLLKRILDRDDFDPEAVELLQQLHDTYDPERGWDAAAEVAWLGRAWPVFRKLKREFEREAAGEVSALSATPASPSLPKAAGVVEFTKAAGFTFEVPAEVPWEEASRHVREVLRLSGRRSTGATALDSLQAKCLEVIAETRTGLELLYASFCPQVFGVVRPGEKHLRTMGRVMERVARSELAPILSEAGLLSLALVVLELDESVRGGGLAPTQGDDPRLRLGEVLEQSSHAWTPDVEGFAQDVWNRVAQWPQHHEEVVRRGWEILNRLRPGLAKLAEGGSEVLGEVAAVVRGDEGPGGSEVQAGAVETEGHRGDGGAKREPREGSPQDQLGEAVEVQLDTLSATDTVHVRAHHQDGRPRNCRLQKNPARILYLLAERGWDKGFRSHAEIKEELIAGFEGAGEPTESGVRGAWDKLAKRLEREFGRELIRREDGVFRGRVEIRIVEGGA